MKVATVVGARPQFIKAAAVSRRLRARHREILIHTGQHYDDGMSAVFFRELEIPNPDYHLDVRSGPHGAQTGRMLAKVEQVLLKELPDWVIVYGDTNSTLAGALAAAKLHVPVAHVEAGLRSFNRRMPEEINRILTDHLSQLLLCPNEMAATQLATEGIRSGVRVIGDVMGDAFADARHRAECDSNIHQRLELEACQYWLATVHRAENTDDLDRLQAILKALSAIGSPSVPVIFSVHPRTRVLLERIGWRGSEVVRLIEPVGYLDMVKLEVDACGILTDSGGIQKEAYWAGVPCTTLRDETEWVETLRLGWNALAGADTARIIAAARRPPPDHGHPKLYWDGHASEHVAAALEQPQ